MIRNLLELETDHHYHLFFRDSAPPELLPDTRKFTVHAILPLNVDTYSFRGGLWRRQHDVMWVPAHTLPRFFPGKAVVNGA